MHTHVRETSLKAYDAIQADGTAKTQAGRVLAFIRTHPMSSRQDIARGTGIPINAVCGRVNELLEAEPPAVVEKGTKFDQISKKNVMALMAMPAQTQLNLGDDRG